VVQLAEGRSVKPFVYRRLTADAADALARVVPRRVWDSISDRVDGTPRLTGWFRTSLGWTRETDPLMFSFTAILAGSALGFAGCALWLVRRLYAASYWVSHVVALALLVGLLGGRGNVVQIWLIYPYDVPQAFLFLAGVCCAVAGNYLVLPLFALAAFNKETSCLLIPAVWLLWPRRGASRRAVVAVMGVTFVALQCWIRWHYREAHAEHFAVLRGNISILLFGSWRLPLWALAGAALWRHRGRIPVELRRMAYVPVVLFLAAVTAGWMFEYRAYMEAYPVVALALIQVTLIELGLGHWLPARGEDAGAGGAAAMGG
jgi:hypothetical protein